MPDRCRFIVDLSCCRPAVAAEHHADPPPDCRCDLKHHALRIAAAPCTAPEVDHADGALGHEYEAAGVD